MVHSQNLWLASQVSWKVADHRKLRSAWTVWTSDPPHQKGIKPGLVWDPYIAYRSPFEIGKEQKNRLEGSSWDDDGMRTSYILMYWLVAHWMA